MVHEWEQEIWAENSLTEETTLDMYIQPGNYIKTDLTNTSNEQVT
jgi:hypothetical protein